MVAEPCLVQTILAQASSEAVFLKVRLKGLSPETPKLLILILPQNYLVYFPLSPSPENY